MAHFIEGLDRQQTMLLPEHLDDYGDENSHVRAIDAFADMLDLAALGFNTQPATTGRPDYHPGLMLRIYVYGYLNQVQSSRRLDRADEVFEQTGTVLPEARMERTLRKLEHLQKEAVRYRSIEQRMDETRETQVSLTDPDARSMATTARMPRIVGYNVQTAVEADNHLIVAHEVTMLGFDRDALSAARQGIAQQCPERG